MRIVLTNGSLVGENTTTRFAQTIKTPYLYGVVEVHDEGGNAVVIGKRVINALMGLRDENVSGHTELLTRLTTAVEHGVVSMIVCVPLGDRIHVFLFGKGSVYLKRNGNIASLLTSDGTINGKAHKGDMYVLLSKSLKESIPSESLMSLFDHLPATDVADKLTILLQKSEKPHQFSGMILEAIDIEEESWTDEKEPTIETPRKAPSVMLYHTKNNRSLKEYALHGKSGLYLFAKKVKRKFSDTSVRIIICIVFVFIVSVIVGIRREIILRKNNSSVAVIANATKLVEEGIALVELNALTSKERFIEAQTLLDANKERISSKTKEGRKMEELYRLISENLPRAMLSYEVTPELFFDIALQKEGSRIDSVGMYDDTLALLDTKDNTTITLSLPTKKAQILTGGSKISSAMCITINSAYVYIVGSEGVVAIRRDGTATGKIVIKKSDEWQTIAGCTAFGGNIYLLDTGKGRIWKYISVDATSASSSAGFSDIREYLNPDSFPDLSGALGISIDGSVWVGTVNGKVYKFTQGKEDTWNPTGVDPALGQKLQIFTNDSLNYLYILDRDNNRVVVLEKNGMYKAQYHWQSGMTPTDLVVSEKLGTILILVDGKLYSIKMK